MYIGGGWGESDEEIDKKKKAAQYFLKSSEPELAIFSFTSLERIGKWLQKCFRGFRVLGSLQHLSIMASVFRVLSQVLINTIR